MDSRQIARLVSEVGRPIEALDLMTRALRRRIEAGTDPAPVLDGMDTGIRQVRRQLASLLDLLRAERRITRLQPVAFSLSPLFRTLLLQTERLARDSRVRLSVVDTRARAVSDPEAVEIILRNLLINAQFFARGRRVLMGCRRRGDRIEVQVCDNGPGIPPEQIPGVFEPFARARQGEGDDFAEGLGLGLAIARELADGLGHELRISSSPTRGTIASLTLPSAPVNAVEARARAGHSLRSPVRP